MLYSGFAFLQVTGFLLWIYVIVLENFTHLNLNIVKASKI